MFWLWVLIWVLSALVAYGWGYVAGQQAERRNLNGEFDFIRKLRCDLLLWEARLDMEQRQREAVDRLIEETR